MTPIKTETARPKFPLGRIVATPGALEALGADDAQRSANLSAILRRHASGDWGELGADDRRENEFSLTRRLRLLSAYTVGGTKLWIITEADRSSTCVLLPAEY